LTSHPILNFKSVRNLESAKQKSVSRRQYISFGGLIFNLTLDEKIG
jgi:hypothetical protein